MLSYTVLQPIFDGDTTHRIGTTVSGDRFSAKGLQALLEVRALAEPEPATALSEENTAAGAATPALVSLNTASESALEKLPHIGPATADKLIAQRPYESLDDAHQAAGLSEAKWAEILPQVTL